MTLDLYKNAYTATVTQRIDEQGFASVCASEGVAELVGRYRSGDADAKRKLPAVTYMGTSTTGRRRGEDMEPTGFVMLDVDHVSDDKLQPLLDRLTERRNAFDPLLVHITPSGHGVRIVARMAQDGDEYATLADYCRRLVSYQQELADRLGLAEFGDVDECVKDLGRLSFVPQACDIKFSNYDGLFHPINFTINELRQRDSRNDEHDGGPGRTSSGERAEHRSADADDGQPSHANFKYGDTLVRDIAAAYVEWKGEPEEGTRHNFYNQMVLDFRNICNNSPQILIDVLPLVGGDRKERMAQCEGLCKRHTSPLIPKLFWIWLKEQGYYVDPREKKEEADTTDAPDPYAEESRLLDSMPSLPPVFREYVNAAPREYKIPTIFALLPIMGTLATYLQAEYYDGAMHTPSFFTIIYAPAGSGKSFINRFLELDVDESGPANLMHEIVQRDFISNARTNLWNAFANTKGANDKGKLRPKTSVRLMETITSQADMLPVMKDNQGMHMFMFAPEIDTMIKGMKSGGGGDKNDIFRVAWDNGTYGQSYRNSISFRGKVALYLNVLATGTPAQCAKLFKDVENGLVTRCSFTDLGQQEFAKFQPWKKLSKKDLQVIDNFRRRCDAATYMQTLSFDLSTLDEYDTEEKFDADVPWEYRFRGRTTVDLTSINKALLKWLEVQRVRAEKDADYARDVFRKRAAGKAFRVALLCYACWNKVGKREQKIIEDFALWFAELDLMKSLKRWSKEYNDFRAQTEDETSTRVSTTLFDELPASFTLGDVRIAASRLCVKSPAKAIVYRWRKANLIKKNATGYEKK